MSSDSEMENLTTPNISEIAEAAKNNMLPAKSEGRYKFTYQKFMEWREKTGIKSFSESVMMSYFQELSNTKKPTSLWSFYSMLKATININHNVDIGNYSKLLALLKKNSDGFKSTTSKILTSKNINDFLENAPDDKYLFMKVALIIGISGACRKQELRNIKPSDVQDTGKNIVINIRDSKTKRQRSFVVSEYFYPRVKKYINVRCAVDGASNLPFFLNYMNGKCTRQCVGINKFGRVPKQIAIYLGLPEAAAYTGHCFRRSSATILVDTGGDLLDLKRQGGWQSSTAAQSVTENEVLNLNQICRTCKCTSSQMVSLFGNYECSDQNVPIDEMLTACTSVQVLFGDGLPAQICRLCLNQLKSAFTFKLQCEKVDSFLRDYANNVKVEEINQELPNVDFVEPLYLLLKDDSTFKQANQESYNQNVENEQKLFRCNVCSDVVTTIKGESVCGCNKSSHNTHQHEQAQGTKDVYVCKICSKKLARKDFLKRHLVTHLKKKPFSCKTCNRVCDTLQSLKSHTYSCKRDVVYPCDVCNKAFSREINLEAHMKLHDDEPKLPTIETLKNFEEYYYQIEQDAATVISDCSEINDCFETKFDDSIDAIKIEVESDLSSNCSETSGINCNVDDIGCLKNENLRMNIEDNFEDSDCLENGDVQTRVEDPLETVDERNRGFNVLSRNRRLCSVAQSKPVVLDMNDM